MDPILENLNRERRKKYRERARRRRRVVLIQRIALAAVVIAIIATTIIVVAKEEKKPINTQAATDSEEVTTEAETTPATVPTEEPTTQAPPKFQEQHSMDWDAEESYLLAKIAMAEAEGESTEGKAMVIMVVLNRVWADGFPDTIEEVIMQYNKKTGVYQFSPVEPGGRWWRVEPDEDCWAALDLIMLQGWDESEGALYFEATYNGENTWHSKNLEYIKTVDNHNFYK